MYSSQTVCVHPARRVYSYMPGSSLHTPKRKHIACLSRQRLRRIEVLPYPDGVLYIRHYFWWIKPYGEWRSNLCMSEKQYFRRRFNPRLSRQRVAGITSRRTRGGKQYTLYYFWWGETYGRFHTRFVADEHDSTAWSYTGWC